MNQHAASVPVVVFVLWDDHIYDAWERKAQELKLTPYDPNMEYQEKIMEPSSSKLDEKQSSKKFNPTVTDLSTPDDPIEKADENTKPAIIRLPSVPHGAPDTQDTEDMDHESAPVHDKPLLTTGNRYVSTTYVVCLCYSLENNLLEGRINYFDNNSKFNFRPVLLRHCFSLCF